MLGAAAHARPQAVVPLFADQWENGVAVTDSGCGTVVEPGRRSVEDFDRALRVLLADPAHAAAVARVAREIEAMPSVDDAVTEIEALVAG